MSIISYRLITFDALLSVNSTLSRGSSHVADYNLEQGTGGGHHHPEMGTGPCKELQRQTERLQSMASHGTATAERPVRPDTSISFSTLVTGDSYAES